MARLAIRMPKMSMTMTEGEVSSWMVKVGDEVAEGDVVCEVMTDKVDMEVESTVAGTLVEIVVESGMVEVGEPIGWVEGEDDGGGFGDLLTEPQPEPTPEPGRARPRPSRSPRRRRAGTRPRRSPGSRARGRLGPPCPGPAAWPASAASTWPGHRHRPRRAGPRGRRRGAVAAGSPSPRRAARRPGSSPQRRRRRSTDRKRRDPGRGRPQDDAERRDPAVHGLARAAARRRQRDAATACPGPPCCCARTPPRCARYRTCCAAGRTTGPPRRARPRSRWPWPPTAGCWCRRSPSPTSATRTTLDAEIRDVVRAAQTGKLGPRVPGRRQRLAVQPRRPRRGPLPGAADAAAGAACCRLGSIQQRPVAVPGGVGLALTVARRPHRRPPGRRRRPRGPAAGAGSRPTRRRPGPVRQRPEVRGPRPLDVTAVTPLYICARTCDTSAHT